MRWYCTAPPGWSLSNPRYPASHPITKTYRRIPSWCHAVIKLYQWWKTYGALPHAGGLLDQAYRTMTQFDIIHHEVEKHEEFQRQQEQGRIQNRRTMGL